MKKLIFFILILIGAVYWGYNQGMSGQKPVRPHISAKEDTKNPLTVGKNLAGEITDMAGAWISGHPVSKEENTEKEDSQKNSADLSSAMERVRRVYHFKESLEAKVDRKQFVSSKDIPDMMKKAIVATEDRRFYDHGALDLVSVTRALVTNYMAGQTLEGGSTIAQQTVKNIFLSHDRTLSRKIEELALAVQLEKKYTKDEILELKAHIKTNLELTCSRCLDTFIYPIDVDIEERFTKSKELQEDEELIFVEDDTLDIIQIVENCIISTLPIKRLCKEDCKGLCSQCGTNKNVKECQCDNFDVDIRLAKLRELFGE